ncbi:hypothetical protein [Herbaspirillum huttiense]|uniref:hypothetical protein n=1 Tax=Herbaspirillum huttiense TaxID=863372 RepID=UPI0031D88790
MSTKISTRNKATAPDAVIVESFKNLGQNLGLMTGLAIDESKRASFEENLLRLCQDLAANGAPDLARDLVIAFIDGVVEAQPN